MTRWRAASAHLLITVVVMASIGAWVVHYWYPPALFRMSGFDRLLLLLVSIDLVAGPLLTLIVYRAGKAGLRFDLAAIGAAQAALLAYGLSVIWEARPVFLVAVHDRFDIVFANQIDPSELALAPDPEWRHLGFTAPKLVGARPPTDPELALRQFLEAFSGRDLPVRPQYYVPFESVAPLLLANAKPLTTMPDDLRKSVLLDQANRLQRPPESLRFVPIASARGFATMLIDADSGLPVAAVSIDAYDM